VHLDPVAYEIFLEKKNANLKLQASAVEIKCAICNSVFKSQEKFDKHTASHQVHPQDKPQLPFNPELTCLFCNTNSLNVTENLQHMMIRHGFFVPDIEFVTDLTQLLSYLHERVRIGLLCLYCDNKGTHQFRDFLCLQQHMIDKQHCFINTDEDKEEYMEFYEYPKEECTALAINNLEIMNTGELRLESGAIVGNKEYRRYYKQYFRPRNQRHAQVLAIMAEEYKTLSQPTSWSTCDDMQAKEMDKQKRELTQGLKNNMLKHHFRRQVPR
jgi:pre-60S factor REI1